MWIRDESYNFLINLSKARYIFINESKTGKYELLVEFSDEEKYIIEGFDDIEDAEKHLNYLMSLLMTKT